VNRGMSLKNLVGFQSLLNSVKEIIEPLDSKDLRDQTRIDYKISDCVISNFAMMFFQDASMLQFQRKMEDEYQSSNLRNLFGIKNIPSDSTLRTMLDKIDPQTFAPIFSNIISKLDRSGELEKFSINGKYLCLIDGSQYHCSGKINCKHCLTKNHQNKTISYAHQVLVPAIVNPKLKEVLPLMPEEIRNEDGKDKQDCEINAAKRLIPKLKQYNLSFILCGDAMFANQNIIELAQENGFSYMLTTKSATLLDRAKNSSNLRSKEVIIKGKKYCYEWLNGVSLNYNKETIMVNYFSLKIIDIKTQKITYQNSWITDLKIEGELVEAFVGAARSRWKIENECFNVLKNNGYQMEHNYGHGEEYLAANYFLLTLLSHLFHQIHQLVDEVYQKLRIKKGPLVVLWSDLKAAIKMMIFDSWDQLINYLLNPPRVYASQLMNC
jgi:hypothetical protein